MIIKKYWADSMEEAKHFIEEELGPEAVILTCKEVKPGALSSITGSSKVEVLAGIEESDYRSFTGKDPEILDAKQWREAAQEFKQLF